MANFLKSLFVKGVEIDTASATAGKVLTYDGTKFAPATPGSGSLALDDLSDVVVTTPATTQFVRYNGTNWVNATISAGDVPTLNQNTTGTAATVTGAAQTAITSVGTLTGLAVAASTGTAMRITNTGTGNSFLVEDSASTDSTPFVIDAAGNVGIGVSAPSNKLDISGNVQIASGNFVVGGQGTFFNSSAEDGIILAPRIGGTGSYRSIFTPATLSASRTYTLPNVTGTMITTGNLSSITSVGTLTSTTIGGTLTVDDTSTPAIRIGNWSSGATYTAIEASGYGYILLGSAADVNTYVRSAAGVVRIGTPTNNTLTVGAVDVTITGSLALSASTNAYVSYANTPDAGMPWMQGPTFQGQTGWAFYSANLGSYRMGYRGSSNNGAIYMWCTDAALIGSAPSDGLITRTLNVNGSLGVSTDAYASNYIMTNYLIAAPGITSSGQSAQWFTAFNQWYLCRNSSTRDDKENIQPLNGIITADMIDEIDILLWSRKNAAGIPEIGPMAEDMDIISPFLSTRGIDYDDEKNTVQTEPNGINTNSWMSLMTIAIQDIRKRLQQLEIV